ncbi:MAG: hypothetical protein IKO05_06055, partial [Selenomonadaceae bacterium]|nr:hypothetical protein [Selenomonadaceae bacterium]
GVNNTLKEQDKTFKELAKVMDIFTKEIERRDYEHATKLERLEEKVREAPYHFHLTSHPALTTTPLTKHLLLRRNGALTLSPSHLLPTRLTSLPLLLVLGTQEADGQTPDKK